MAETHEWRLLPLRMLPQGLDVPADGVPVGHRQTARQQKVERDDDVEVELLLTLRLQYTTSSS